MASKDDYNLGLLPYIGKVHIRPAKVSTVLLSHR